MTRRIALVETCAPDDVGDLLRPLLVERALAARLGPLEVSRYAPVLPRAGEGAPAARPVKDLAADVDRLDALVLTGGWAPPLDTASTPADPEGPGVDGCWLAAAVAAASGGLPAAWDAVSLAGDRHARGGVASPLLGLAAELSAYIAVRGERSLVQVQAAAPGVPVALVPDPLLAAHPTITSADDPEEGRALLARLGVDGPYAVVQATALSSPDGPALAAALRDAADAGLTLLALPDPRGTGGRPIAAVPTARLVAVDPWPGPVAVAALVRGARALVAHSPGLALLGAAAGVGVHVLAPAAGDPALTAFRDVRPCSPATSDLGALLAQGPREEPDPAVVRARAAVADHWDRMAQALAEGPTAARRSRFRRALLAHPAALASAAAPAADHGPADHGPVAEAPEAETPAAAELAHHRRRSADLASQVRALGRDLEARAQQVRRTEDRLRRTERELDRLRSRRAVAAALRAAELLGPAYRMLRRAAGPLGGTGGPPARPRVGARATPQQEAAFVARLGTEAAPNTRGGGPLVSVVIPNRSGAHHLRRCLPELTRATYRDVEVVVVDNGSADDSLDELARWADTLRLTVVPNLDNQSFSAAINQGVAAAQGPLILLLNNDVTPIQPGWLGRMVDTLEQRRAGAVGARLVYPRRAARQGHGDDDYDDLSLQHGGIGFVTVDGMPWPRHAGVGTDPFAARAGEVREVPAVTAACMLVRRDALEAVGGLDEGYEYGTEDVDLCLRLRRAGWAVWYDGGAVLWHHEYGTQDTEGRERKRANRAANRERFLDHWGPQVSRTVLLDRLRGERFWTQDPLHVAITLTHDDPERGWGDYYTAHELGDELERLGWRVTYAERYADRWYDLPTDVDVLVSLLDAYDLRRAPRGAVRVAWVRNWTHRWLSRPWFDDYDLVLASSGPSQRLIERHSTHVAVRFPLATNPRRFRPGPVPSTETDVLFAGNHWAQPRPVAEALPLLPPSVRTRVYGLGWEKVPQLAGVHAGALAYGELPAAYRGARVVVDDTAAPTKPYAAVNTRVFDALAAGALVLTDNAEGVRELFDEEFPSWDAPESLPGRVAELLADPERAETLVARYRRQVLERHTYAVRAGQLRDALVGWAEADHVGLRAGVPPHDDPQTWGDYHYARAVQRHLRRAGRPARVHLLADWSRAAAARDDVTVHLLGLSDLRTRPAQVSVLWSISHPVLLTPERAAGYDLVLVASDSAAAELGRRTSVPVQALHQATDPERFRPDTTGPAHELLFVGNSRKVRRRVLADLLPTDRDLAVYGRHWSRDLLDPRHLRGDHVPNEELHRYYSSAAIVLNDHWDDMRAAGYLSNRLYDALASGAFVISDHVPGIEEEFDGGVVTYRDRGELRRLVETYLGDPAARRERAERGRAAVLARHTFSHRVTRLLALVDPLLRDRARTLALPGDGGRAGTGAPA